ncbi:Putative outer membrane protein [Fulvivirga imtechensis AK7]|uniref:Putative outer membrane protein n=1 Tax=Fulvivirga imtechensis AK7 TaxID=1237149 RepID=L8K004_9BACT|nr:OmpA family protein [Fulvivirga imtechensis]ELR72787.1 Putative outer membrane protein [Fulvivirga imtechensis AK7]
MGFNRMFGVLVAVCICFGAAAQNEDTTLVMVKADIIDADTREPVKAKIKYESLPYGSKIGVFSGNSFSFNIENGSDYAVMITADGYSPYSETIKASDATDRRIFKTIELKPTGVNKLIRLEKLIFALGRAEITDASHQELDELVEMLKQNENITIQLEGHTDFRGNAKQNMKLSEERVEAVKEYLVGKGIDKKRIKTRAFGGTQPLSRGDDNESRRSNRRVEVRILSN